MQPSTDKDRHRGASMSTPPTTNNGQTEPRKPKAKRSWFVVNTTTGSIKAFEKKPEMFKWLNDDPEAPKYGSYEILVGAKMSLRQTVALG